MNPNIALILFAILLILIIAVIIAMFVSFAKQEDERRRTIVEKASSKTFAITILYLLYCIAKNIFNVVSGKDSSPEGLNPFITLTAIAVIYAIELLYHKKKYGD